MSPLGPLGSSVSLGDRETETSFGRVRRVSAGRRQTRGARGGDERETRGQNAGDEGETVSKTKTKNLNASFRGDEGETVSPETSFRNRETSSARLPLSPRTLPSTAKHRGTSLITNTPLPGPYSRTTPRVLW